LTSDENFKILVVDDEVQYQDVFRMILEDKGYSPQTASSGGEALKMLASESYDLVLTDLMMAGMDGVELLGNIKKLHPSTEVIIVTGYGTIENAVKAIKQGAFSYFIKSHDPEELLIEVGKLERIHKLQAENALLRKEKASNKYELDTKNSKFRSILNVIDKAAESNASIFLTGESGVGKEVMARYIHNKSRRSSGNFVAVNCQSIPENLLESELFGHEKGSFTGASERRIGKFQEASGGTLFLDEIGELPVNLQTKLLRALETRTIERIGNSKPIDVDIRLISATNRSITDAIRKGTFREDLFYRLNTILVEIPPLRERKEDLLSLAEFFFSKCRAEQKKKIKSIDSKVMDFLLSYDYPGNIRELRNIIERLVVLADNGCVSEKDLPDYAGNSNESLVIQAGFQDDPEAPEEIKPLKDFKRRFEAEYIRKALVSCGGNMTEAAKLLGISRRQLFNKVMDYGLKTKRNM
jgi:two-component system, NtrC family, response regulator HydG